MRKLWSRNEELKKIIRYGTAWEWEPMFYRPDLLIHTKRVFWMTQELTKYLQTINPDIFSKEITDELATFHDDTEIITGDVLSAEKEAFTIQQKKDYEEQSIEAINSLHEAYHHLTGLNYKELLLLDHKKDSIEYLIVCYADKLDAHMEICQEIFAGNTLCISPLSRWNLEILPYDYTRNKIMKLEKKLSEAFWFLLKDSHPLFKLSEVLDFRLAHKKGSPHTSESIKNKTWYTLTDYWRQLHFMYWNSREKEYLWNQKEFT